MRRLVALVLGWCRRETDIPEFVRRTPADDPAMVAARRALGIEDPLLTVDADDVPPPSGVDLDEFHAWIRADIDRRVAEREAGDGAA